VLIGGSVSKSNDGSLRGGKGRAGGRSGEGLGLRYSSLFRCLVGVKRERNERTICLTLPMLMLGGIAWCMVVLRLRWVKVVDG
jgi:hypothetical protein